jgi:hypothetical protein
MSNVLTQIFLFYRRNSQILTYKAGTIMIQMHNTEHERFLYQGKVIITVSKEITL